MLSKQLKCVLVRFLGEGYEYIIEEEFGCTLEEFVHTYVKRINGQYVFAI